MGKVIGSADDATRTTGTRLMREALRLLAGGEPITVAQLSAAAGLDADLDLAPAGADIEYDELGGIVGWGLTLNRTPHRFAVDGHQLYTWCAPDALLFPAIIGRAAQIESPCPATRTPVRLTVDSHAGVTALDPATAVVGDRQPRAGQLRPAVHPVRPATLLRQRPGGPRLARPAPRRDRAAGRRRLRRAPPHQRSRPGRGPDTQRLLTQYVFRCADCHDYSHGDRGAERGRGRPRQLCAA